MVYDLQFYPAASKSKGDEVFLEMDISKEKPVKVYVGYEHGETDDDQEFDQNDITWCQIFADNDNGIIKVFDVETA